MSGPFVVLSGETGDTKLGDIWLSFLKKYLQVFSGCGPGPCPGSRSPSAVTDLVLATLLWDTEGEANDGDDRNHIFICHIVRAGFFFSAVLLWTKKSFLSYVFFYSIVYCFMGSWNLVKYTVTWISGIGYSDLTTGCVPQCSPRWCSYHLSPWKKKILNGSSFILYICGWLRNGSSL